MFLAPFLESIKHVLLRGRGIRKPIISTRFNFIRTMCAPSHVSFFQEQEEDLALIEEWLLKYPGGKVNFHQDHETGIAKISLDRPDKLNAMSGQMMVEFGRAVQMLEKWPEGKGVIVCGKGKMLCSGGDLDFARATGNAKGGFRMATYMHNVLSRLKNLPLVSVAVIHGQGALGGGAEIAASCDWRLITSDCRGIGFVHSRMGIVPAWGATTRLVKMLGESRALEALVSAKIFGPSEALSVGLVDEIIQTERDAENWLEERTKASPEVIQAAKLTVVGCQQQLDNEKRAQDYERRLFSPLWGGRANREALNSRLKHL